MSKLQKHFEITELVKKRDSEELDAHVAVGVPAVGLEDLGLVLLAEHLQALLEHQRVHFVELFILHISRLAELIKSANSVLQRFAVNVVVDDLGPFLQSVPEDEAFL